jgi:hypothetical protein
VRWNRPLDALGQIIEGMRRPPLIDIDIPALRPGTVGAYAFGLVLVGLATALRLAIDPYIVGVQYVTFFPVVIITTLISGLWSFLSCAQCWSSCVLRGASPLLFRH